MLIKTINQPVSYNTDSSWWCSIQKANEFPKEFRFGNYDRLVFCHGNIDDRINVVNVVDPIDLSVGMKRNFWSTKILFHFVQPYMTDGSSQINFIRPVLQRIQSHRVVHPCPIPPLFRLGLNLLKAHDLWRTKIVLTFFFHTLASSIWKLIICSTSRMIVESLDPPWIASRTALAAS